ncbi:hypothetical protein Agub_g5034 [Astrephomene gubernaculifera]|uniref:C3H1-type domain-containing protein n=1 Tax=Astrephomene gubernaculifera TaxID=47775 RepID=A0AAD3DL84_9CHLO|nr:hypothetical protein Agub_g5034 [Astrephomene gubernaculifera]
MTSYTAAPAEGTEAGEAPQLAAYNQAAGLISSLTSASHHPQSIGANSYSPSLDLLTQHGIQVPLGSGQPQAQQQAQQGPSGGLAFSSLGLRPAGPFSASVSDAGRKAETGEKQLCTFFLRTGTCAYGDRCKFKHPLDRPPPQLNSRGYPVRAEEPDCAHYLKKGWCAFGPTCKFNHPEIQPSILNSYSLSQPAATYVGLPTTTFPTTTVYSVPPAMPTLYYIPPGITPGQLGGSTVSLLPSNVGTVTASQASQLAFQQQAAALAGAAPAQLYRQPAGASPYGPMGAAMGAGMGGAMAGGMGNSVTALEAAFQSMALGRAGGLGRGK